VIQRLQAAIDNVGNLFWRHSVPLLLLLLLAYYYYYYYYYYYSNVSSIITTITFS